MSLTKPIPDDAMPVVKILRRDVPKPTTLPTSMWQGSIESLRWEEGTRQPSCPMGLHKDATRPCPICSLDFPASNTAIRAFYRWFDSQTDAQATVDAIWPKEAN